MEYAAGRRWDSAVTPAENEAGAAASIAAVERDTGLSKDTLRVWERRYGFPAPVRGAQGERSYPPEQVHKLRVLKRLVDRGHRPGLVVPLPLEVLLERAAGLEPARPDAGAVDFPQDQWLESLRQHDAYALRRHFAQALLRLGLERFVTEIVAPMNRAVGQGWMTGQIQIFEEHLYTECVQTTLRQALATLPPGRSGAPRVLLATVPQEPHGLGLLMAEALFSLQGCHCLSLGVRVPVPDIAQAARAHRADIVGLSFTESVGVGQVHGALRALRAMLPASVELWAGGQSPALQRRPPPGVVSIGEVVQVPAQLARWRAARASAETP